MSEEDNISFDEAASMLGESGANVSSINSTVSTLNETRGELQKSKNICDNPEIELQKVRTHIWYFEPPSLAETPDPSRKTLTPQSLEKQVIKKDIDSIIKKYEEVAQNTNIIINNTNDAMKNLYQPSLKIQENIEKTKVDFENSIKELCVPLKNKQKGLEEIQLITSQRTDFGNEKNVVDEKISSFIDIGDDLVKTYNSVYDELLKDVKDFCKAVNGLPLIVRKLKEEIECSFDRFEENMQDFDGDREMKDYKGTFEELRVNLVKVMTKVDNTKDEISKVIESFHQESKDRKENIEKAGEQTDKYVKDLTGLSEEISNEINSIRERYGKPRAEMKKLEISQTDSIQRVCDSIDAGKDRVCEGSQKVCSKLEEFSNQEIVKFNACLDLLIIMDITDSMNPYVDDVKNKLLKMIKKLNDTCPNCELLIGFIGYKDFEDLNRGEKYIDIDFSKDYRRIKSVIEGIKVSGGGDIAEDVAGALEMSLNKSWKSELKCVVFVTDSACHGYEYNMFKKKENVVDDYPEGDPLKRDIKSFIYRLASLNINFFAVKLNEYSKHMYKIFGEKYKECKYKEGAKCEYYIYELQEADKLTDFIVNCVQKTYCLREEEGGLIDE